MSEVMAVALGFAISVQLLCMIFNAGALFAYFQRNRMDQMEELHNTHMLQAILYGLLGILVSPGIWFAVEYPKFGLKFWRAEFPSEENPWYQQYTEAIELRREREGRSHKRSLIPDGHCEDIWRD